MGLLGDEVYSGTALTTSETLAVLVRKTVFLTLMDLDKTFRSFVLRAFGTRMTDLTRVLEQVVFASMESRLADALLEMMDHGKVRATQAELAARIGTAREVVTRQLQTFASKGLAQIERRLVTILDEDRLRQISDGLL